MGKARVEDTVRGIIIIIIIVIIILLLLLLSHLCRVLTII
jgi:hypothetical protein